MNTQLQTRLHISQRLISHVHQVLPSLLNLRIFVSSDKAYVPAGVNGPHFAVETPVRNTCHLISLVCDLVQSGELDAKSGIELIFPLCNWLINQNPFFVKGVYVARQKGRADWTNGVIGPAWIIEALSRAHALLSWEPLEERKEAVVRQLKFNDRLRVWHRFDPFTGRTSPDLTIDHQAWLAAALSEAGEERASKSFLDACGNGLFRVRHNGLINHGCVLVTLGSVLRRAMHSTRNYRGLPSTLEVEAGYQVYTLHAFARLKRYFPEHAFFQSVDFRRALSLVTRAFCVDLLENRFAFPYNAPGFELPLVFSSFCAQMDISEADVLDVFDIQMSRTFNDEIALHAVNVPDPITLSLRLYELIMAFVSFSPSKIEPAPEGIAR